MKRLLFLLISGLLLISCSKSGKNTIKQIGEVRMLNDRPTMFINGKPVAPMLYALPDQPTGRWSWDALPQHNIRQFYSHAGIKLFQVDIFLDHVWMPDGSIKLDTALMQIRGVIDHCPDASVFFRLHVNAPFWWQRQHPEEAIKYSNIETNDDYKTGFMSFQSTDLANVPRFSLASEKWRMESSEAIRKFLKKLSNTTEGNSLVGVQVACGVYGEWHYYGFLENDPDTSVSMTNYFRNWLKSKYKTDENLKAAWRNPDVTLANATVPDSKQRNKTENGVFRNPETEFQVIDYFEAQHLVVAEDIIHFGKVVKDSWPRPIITGAFYGYFYSLFTREAAGGHLAIDTVLKSPYIDYLASPQAYYPSVHTTGRPYYSRGLLESIRLNGKLWLDEMDQQPPLISKNDSGYNASVHESIARIRRNVMFTATKGMGLWFFDFGVHGISWEPEIVRPDAWANTKGWWDQPDILKDISNIKKVVEKNLEKPYQSDADVLMIYDTRSFYHTVSAPKKTNTTNILVNWVTANLMTAGVAFDAIYLSDLPKVNLKKYKVVLFNNTFVISKNQKDYIKQNVMKDGRDIIWFYAPGFCDGKSNNTQNMSELTGIQLAECSDNEMPVFKLTNLYDKSITCDIFAKQDLSDNNILQKYTVCDSDSPYKPLFKVADKNVTIFGNYIKTSSVAIAKKRLRDCNSWYVALPAYEKELVHGLINQSQAHKYIKENDIIYSGNGLLSIHSKNGGKKEITLKNGKIKTLEFKKNSTVILDNETGKILMN